MSAFAGSEFCREFPMPIRAFLDGQKFDSETIRVMGIAFEMARVGLGLSDRDEPAKEIVAKRVIELAKAGERNPDLLCDDILKEFRGRLGARQDV